MAMPTRELACCDARRRPADARCPVLYHAPRYDSYASKPSVDVDLMVVGAVGLSPFRAWTSTSRDDTCEMARTARCCDDSNRSLCWMGLVASRPAPFFLGVQ